MLGEALEQIALGEAGVPGDRHWAIRDEQRGGIRGGKKLPQLMKFGAVSGAGAPTITSPDGEAKSASDDDINDWLSAKLEHPVSLWPLLPKEQLEHYRRGPPDDEDFEANCEPCLVAFVRSYPRPNAVYRGVGVRVTLGYLL